MKGHETLMFDFGNANEGQMKSYIVCRGARSYYGLGPGTGKTHTLRSTNNFPYRRMQREA